MLLREPLEGATEEKIVEIEEFSVDVGMTVMMTLQHRCLAVYMYSRSARRQLEKLGCRR